MAQWRYKINLHRILFEMDDKYDLSCVEEDCPEEVKEELAKEVEKAIPLQKFGVLFRRAKSIAAVNRVLNQVYDAADENLVWCGMPGD